MTEPARLVTIAFSHYCEKARWALDHVGQPYREEQHVPGFHAGPARRAGGSRTVPVLVTAEGALPDSTDILVYLDGKAPGGLFPRDPEARAEVEALEDLFDRRLGPATRRLAYFLLLPDTAGAVRLFKAYGPRSQTRLVGLVFPLLRFGMRRAMKIDAAGAERSRKAIDDVFAEVERRLADGRRYLVGDAFTAADLTFAALTAPLVMPAEYGVQLPALPETPPAFQSLVQEMRGTAAGQLALRLYAEHRRAP